MRRINEEEQRGGSMRRTKHEGQFGGATRSINEEGARRISPGILVCQVKRVLCML